jgi:hypothetical protein
MIAGITAQTISTPRGEFGIGALSPLIPPGLNAARRMASSATMQSAAAIQKIASASELLKTCEYSLVFPW